MISSKLISILIADDYFLIREGLKRSLKTIKNVQIVGEIQRPDEIAKKVGQFFPDILLIEINLCQKSVKELVKEVTSLSPQTRIVIISDCECSLPVIASIKAGVAGFLRKNVSKDELLEAIGAVMDGRQYFSKEIANILIQGYSNKKSTNHSLSERELEILNAICKGKNNEQIGEWLFISDKTVATHRRNIMKKAKVKKTSDLIIWALENNIVER